ncbi:ABC transporter substrate-binding protein [Ruania alba]|uniref:ABC-type dipeptide/oligopeptide/nickel transport system, permease component n=1 Tax=Ruania alba TaxID=648782 RepID=A0A1H5MR25_9MICO|nr:ABC transporter substrate-binding protein [Ruania alba]SEE91784.1 ABC-type dipeptide/oligopeptide/nickel transport system, permease component [Ruania alba]
MNGAITVSRRLFVGGGLGAAAATLTGCNFQQDATVPEGSGDGDGPSGKLTLVQSTATIDSLDPHYVSNAMLVLPAGLLEGLVFSNDEGTDVVPAAAESWEVSDDGLTYTFTMRDGATWSNGDPVTSADVLWTYERLLTPTGAGSNFASGSSSYQVGLGIKGAADFLSGAESSFDSVGISAPDDATVVIELEAPNPDFLILLTHYSMVLLHQGSVEADDTGWQEPEGWVGNGAYVPTSWAPTSSLVLQANPNYWDREAVSVGTIEMRLGGDSATNLVAFKSGELDVVTVSASSVQNDEDIQDRLVDVSGYGTSYLQRMWGGHPALTDARVRRALSMAIDREALAAVGGGSVAGTSLVPNVVPDWSDELAIGYDVDGARSLLEEAGLGDGLPDARVQFNFESAWLEALREQWADALGLTLNIEILESGVHSDTRWAPHEDTSVMSFYAGTFSGLPTMNNWVYNIFGVNYVRQFSLSAEDWLAYQAVQADEGLSGPEKAEETERILANDSTPRRRNTPGWRTRHGKARTKRSAWRSSSRRRRFGRRWRSPFRSCGTRCSGLSLRTSADWRLGRRRRATTSSISGPRKSEPHLVVPGSVAGAGPRCWEEVSMRVAVFIGRRVLRMVLCLIAVSVLTFVLLQLAPGDFAGIQAVGGGTVGLAADATAESTAGLAARYGADVPLWEQYLRFMAGAVTGDMGPSYKYPQSSVEEIIAGAFPISASLAALAIAVAVMVAVPIGVLAAVRRRSPLDWGTMFVATLGHGLPNYLAGLVLVLIFAAGLGLFPTFGWTGPENMVLPVLALAISPIGQLARYVRSSVLENLREEYVVAARSKGGTARTILVRHVLRNSTMPLVTVVGPMFAGLATGTIFVEKIFGIPGLGHYFTEAAAARDMPLLMGTTLFFAALLMLMNLIVDLSYAVLDPRVRADLGLAGRGGRRMRTKGHPGAGSADQRSTTPTVAGPI